MTSSSVSSLSAKFEGGSSIISFMHSWRTTSSTVSVGSIRVRTVTLFFVVTLFVGTSAADFGRWPLRVGVNGGWGLLYADMSRILNEIEG